MKRYIQNTLLLISVIVFAQCARVSSPTGGPEDETPPVLLSSVPNDQQIQYTGNTIVLNFDEYVTTNNIETNLIITPKITGAFKSRIKKRSVILTFDEPWEESTTYNINFGNTIQDLNNRNVPPNLNLSFSTGDYIDSLEITGTITDVYSKDPVENALVSLYTVTDTLDITSGAASYYARTDTSGIYRFRNLPDGDYLIYSALDKNSNQKADVDEEPYGFLVDTIRLTQNVSGIDFDLQRLDINPIKVKSARHFGKYFDIELSKAFTSFEILNNDTLPYRKDGDKKLRFYNTSNRYNDTIPVIFQANDSIDTQLQDTVQLYFNESKKVEKDPFDVKIEPNANAVVSTIDLKFVFDKPVVAYNPDSLIFEVDSLNKFNLPDTAFTWNTNRTEASYPLNLADYIQADQRLNIRLQKGAFVSVEQDSTANKLKAYSILKAEDSGVINGSVNTNVENFIVQLLNSRTLEVIDTKVNEKNFSFRFLDAGSYSVKVIFDLNGNGVWDIGNILNRTTAEPIVYFIDSFNDSKIIELRKNWEVDDIDISYQVNNQ